METKTNNKPLLLGIGLLGVVVVVGLGSFYGGAHYQKAKDGSATNLTDGSYSQNGNSPGMLRPRLPQDGALWMGTVTAVSNSSITVKSATTGESKTYAITSSTQIIKDESIAAVSDIATGTTVMIEADSKATGNALRIVINPTAQPMGGPVNGNIQMN